MERMASAESELDRLHAKVDQAVMLLHATDAATYQARIMELEELSVIGTVEDFRHDL
jgi:hypothetical protein